MCHNLDMMHIKKIVFNNIYNIVMIIKEKINKYTFPHGCKGRELYLVDIDSRRALKPKSQIYSYT